MEIRRYTKQDEQQLFNLMEREGEEWMDYWSEAGRPDYIQALEESTATYVVICEGQLCGFVRCIGHVTIYVDDLLVDADYRGREFGRYLMETVHQAYPDKEVYVLSDVDAYYAKLGYEKAGTVFAVSVK